LFDVAAEMGISEDEFLDMTPRQFAAWQRGENNRYREHAELVRVSTYMICAPNLKQGTSVRRFWPLPWDEALVFEAQTKEVADAFRDRAKAIIKQKRKQNGNNR